LVGGEQLAGHGAKAAPLVLAQPVGLERLEGAVEHYRRARASGPKLESLDLAGGRLREIGDELDPTWVLVGRDLVFHEELDPIAPVSSGTAWAWGLPSRSVSSRPTTAASSTASWRISVPSTSTGETQMPPTFSMSSERPQYQ